MKNSEKNLRKNNFLFYLIIFSLTLLLTFGGIYFYYTAEDRKLEQQITLIKEANAQYKQTSNNSIVSINERNIQDKEYLTKKLRKDANLKPNTRKKLKELLKEIGQDISPNIDQETLEKKTEEERKEIIRKVSTTQLKINKFKSAIIKMGGEKFDEINYLKKQNEWLKKFYPESEQSKEDKEVTAELKRSIKHFYEKFMEEKSLSPSPIVQLVKNENGEYYPPDGPKPEVVQEEINKLKIRRPGINPDEKMVPNFLGFQGWITEENREKGTITAGLTTHFNGMTLPFNQDEPRFDIELSRDIKITLHKGFPFSRKGKEYNLWLSKTDEEFSNIWLGWKHLIETIAHELAHAVINTTKIYYREAKKVEEDGKVREEGGHGILHREYTKELHEMIKKDPEYKRLKDFWFKK